MDPKVQQAIQVLQSARKLNLKDPAQLSRAKAILGMANKFKAMPSLDPALSAELMRFYDTVGAHPAVAGIKDPTVQDKPMDMPATMPTPVQGNKWEAMNPPLPPLGKKVK